MDRGNEENQKTEKNSFFVFFYTNLHSEGAISQLPKVQAAVPTRGSAGVGTERVMLKWPERSADRDERTGASRSPYASVWKLPF